jgi:putative transposase
MLSKATLCSWRKKYNGMDAYHVKKLKPLQEENRRLKQMYAVLILDYNLTK